jgi:hypothetical protein
MIAGKNLIFILPPYNNTLMPFKKCFSQICLSIAQQKNHSKFLWYNTGKFTQEMKNCFYLNPRYDKSTGKQKSQNRDKKIKKAEYGLNI